MRKIRGFIWLELYIVSNCGNESLSQIFQATWGYPKVLYASCEVSVLGAQKSF